MLTLKKLLSIYYFHIISRIFYVVFFSSVDIFASLEEIIIQMYVASPASQCLACGLLRSRWPLFFLSPP